MDNNNLNIPDFSLDNKSETPNNRNGISEVSVSENVESTKHIVEPPVFNNQMVKPPSVGNNDLKFNEEDGKILVPAGLESLEPVNPQTVNQPITPQPEQQIELQEKQSEQTINDGNTSTQDDTILENKKMEKVVIDYTPPSKFKKFVMVFMFSSLLAAIIFMPQINMFLDKLKEEKPVEVPEELVMNGTLFCSFQTNNDKYDLIYSDTFSFTNREIQNLTYSFTTKGDKELDSIYLQSLYNNCTSLSSELATKQYGVDVACDITGGTVRIDQSIDYSKYSSEVESLFKKYNIELADYEAGQNIGDIENELKQSNYICFMESKSE